MCPHVSHTDNLVRARCHLSRHRIASRTVGQEIQNRTRNGVHDSRSAHCRCNETLIRAAVPTNVRVVISGPARAQTHLRYRRRCYRSTGHSTSCAPCTTCCWSSRPASISAQHSSRASFILSTSIQTERGCVSWCETTPV